MSRVDTSQPDEVDDRLEFEIDTIENIVEFDDLARPVYRQVLTRTTGRHPY